MNYRKANRAFLYSILSTLGLVFLYAIWTLKGGADMPMTLNNALSELVVLIPMVSVVLFHGDRLGVLIPLKKIRVPSALFIILYTFFLYPLVTFVNAVSMLFVDNTVLDMSDKILEMPMWQMFLFIGILGPFIEEIIFRGIILQSYQRSGRIIGSILLSSILFGVIHMNFNQFAYGAVMGIMFALLVEATGSVLSSFLCHALFNSIEVLFLYMNADALEGATEYLEGLNVNNIMYMSIGIYFILALIGTPIALCIVYKISEMEGRKGFFASIPKCRKKGYRLITAPLVVAVVLAFAYMAAMAMMSGLV